MPVSNGSFLWCPWALVHCVSQLSTAGPAVLTTSRLKRARDWSPLRSLRWRQSTATLVEYCTEKVPALYQTLFFPPSDHQRKKSCLVTRDYKKGVVTTLWFPTGEKSIKLYSRLLLAGQHKWAKFKYLCSRSVLAVKGVDKLSVETYKQSTISSVDTYKYFLGHTLVQCGTPCQATLKKLLLLKTLLDTCC